MGFSVTVEGLTALQEDVKRAGANIKPLVRAALVNSINRTQSNIRKLTPHRTGNLQRSILTQMEYPIGMVSSQEKYGAYIEFGTSPYTITPKNKKALYWKGAAHPVMAVHHPGIKARPFFKPGVTESLPYVEDQFSQVLEQVVTQLAGGMA